MLSFAVKVKGLDDNIDRCRWVIAVDPVAGVLVAEEGVLGWYPLEDCTFIKMLEPGAPLPVVPVQPKQQPKIARPTALDLRNGGVN